MSMNSNPIEQGQRGAEPIPSEMRKEVDALTQELRAVPSSAAPRDASGTNLDERRAFNNANRPHASADSGAVVSGEAFAGLPEESRQELRKFADYLAAKQRGDVIISKAAISDLETRNAELRALLERAEVREREALDAHGASFSAMDEIRLLLNMEDLDSYSEVVARVRSELEASREDTTRLDWLDDTQNFYTVGPAKNMVGVARGWGFWKDGRLDKVGLRCHSLREAIDAARTPATPVESEDDSNG